MTGELPFGGVYGGQARSSRGAKRPRAQHRRRATEQGPRHGATDPLAVTIVGCWLLRDSTPFLPVTSVMSVRFAKIVAIFYSHPATFRPRTNVLRHPFQMLSRSSPALLSLHARLSQSGRTIHKSHCQCARVCCSASSVCLVLPARLSRLSRPLDRGRLVDREDAQHFAAAASGTAKPFEQRYSGQGSGAHKRLPLLFPGHLARQATGVNVPPGLLKPWIVHREGEGAHKRMRRLPPGPPDHLIRGTASGTDVSYTGGKGCARKIATAATRVSRSPEQRHCTQGVGGCVRHISTATTQG